MFSCDHHDLIFVRIYCDGFAAAFAVMTIISGVQLTLYLFNEGCSFSIPKVLMFLFFALGIGQ